MPPSGERNGQSCPGCAPRRCGLRPRPRAHWAAVLLLPAACLKHGGQAVPGYPACWRTASSRRWLRALGRLPTSAYLREVTGGEKIGSCRGPVWQTDGETPHIRDLQGTERRAVGAERQGQRHSRHRHSSATTLGDELDTAARHMAHGARKIVVVARHRMLGTELEYL